MVVFCLFLLFVLVFVFLFFADLFIFIVSSMSLPGDDMSFAGYFLVRCLLSSFLRDFPGLV